MMDMMGGGQSDGVASGMMNMSDMSQMMQLQQMMRLQQMMQMTQMMLKCPQMMAGMADHPDMQMKSGDMPPKG